MPSPSERRRAALSVLGSVLLLVAYPLGQNPSVEFLWSFFTTGLGGVFLAPLLLLSLNAVALVSRLPVGLGGLRVVLFFSVQILYIHVFGFMQQWGWGYHSPDHLGLMETIQFMLLHPVFGACFLGLVLNAVAMIFLLWPFRSTPPSSFSP